jgi:hypothetical protein
MMILGVFLPPRLPDYKSFEKWTFSLNTLDPDVQFAPFFLCSNPMGTLQVGVHLRGVTGSLYISR